MRFGCWIPNCRYLATPDIIRATAVRAEQLGYDSVLVSDHVVVPSANVLNFGEAVFDPLVTPAVAAGTTSRVGLGTTVLIVPSRPNSEPWGGFVHVLLLVAAVSGLRYVVDHLRTRPCKFCHSRAKNAAQICEGCQNAERERKQEEGAVRRNDEPKKRVMRLKLVPRNSADERKRSEGLPRAAAKAAAKSVGARASRTWR